MIDLSDLSIFSCQRTAGWPDPACCPTTLAPGGAVVITDPTAPVLGSTYAAGTRVEYPKGTPWDMAFALTTTCGTPPQDIDGDADVDLVDFAVFSSCFNGPNHVWPAPADQHACACQDRDSEGDVDLPDFAAFAACFNGPNNPPACSGS